MSNVESPVDRTAAAELCGLSQAAFWRSVTNGTLPQPFYPASRAPRWYPSELRAALLATRSTSREQKERRHRARATLLAA